MLKLSEMLGLRVPPSSSASNTPKNSYHQAQNSTDEKDSLIRSLLGRHQGLLERLKNYKIALLTAKQVHRDTAQVRFAQYSPQISSSSRSRLRMRAKVHYRPIFRRPQGALSLAMP